MPADPHVTTGASVKHTYGRTGTFTVTLTIIDSSGVVTTSTHHVKVTR